MKIKTILGRIVSYCPECDAEIRFINKICGGRKQIYAAKLIYGLGHTFNIGYSIGQCTKCYRWLILNYCEDEGNYITEETAKYMLEYL